MPFNRPIPDDQQRGKPADAVQGLVQAEKVMQIALVLPSAVLIGWLGGMWLDARLHQTWITLAGFILGSVSGMASAIRMAISFGADPKTKASKGDGTEKGSSGREP